MIIIDIYIYIYTEFTTDRSIQITLLMHAYIVIIIPAAYNINIYILFHIFQQDCRDINVKESSRNY